MIVIEMKSNEWFCTSSMTLAKQIAGFNYKNAMNVWYQPFSNSDFFWALKDGVLLKEDIPMRNWELDLPLSQCLKGNVRWVASKPTTKPPVWYREFLATDWIEHRIKEKERALAANEKVEKAKSLGDKNAEIDAIIDFLLGD